MSPVIDLAAILAPIIGTVADLVFPDLVTIEEPNRTQDATGDTFDTWDTLYADVPAVIAPLNARTSAQFTNIPVGQTDVTITLAGDRDIHLDYRIRSQTIPPSDPDARPGDRWDVLGVSRDEARVTTTVLARRREPGTPDEGS